MKHYLLLFAILFLIWAIFAQQNGEELSSLLNQEMQKENQVLYPNNPNTDLYFGVSVSITEDNILVGAAFYDYYHSYLPGSSYLFQKENNQWSLKQLLNISDGANGDAYGYSTAISRDIIVIGAPFANVSGNVRQGKAYVFKRSEKSWFFITELQADDGQQNDQFGGSVSISGRVIAISAPYATIGENYSQGCVYIFNSSEDGLIWNQTAKINSVDGGQSIYFGTSIALSKTSSLLVVGEPGGRAGGNFAGQASVFKFDGNFWNRIAVLYASEGQYQDWFGESVAISNDTISDEYAIIVIGAPSATVGNQAYQGKAYVFRNDGTFWMQEETFFANGSSVTQYFGQSVAISNDSSLILVGAVYSEYDQLYTGKVYVFKSDGKSWSLYRVLAPSDETDPDYFGNSVAIFGNDVIVGSPQSGVSGFTSSGKAYFFDLTEINPPITTGSSSSSSKTTIIVCSTVIPIGLILSIFLVFYFFRRKNKKKEEQKNSQDYSRMDNEN